MEARFPCGEPLSFSVTTNMWDTCSVNLKVRVPRDIAEQVEEVQRSDPEFLSRVVIYGLTRRSIFRHLREDGVGHERPVDGRHAVT